MKGFFFEKKNQKTFISLGRDFPHRSRPRHLRVFCFFFSKKKAFLLLAFLSTCHAAVAARTLRVSLYPYIPDVARAARTLKAGFERTHPGVRLLITLNPNYYSLQPAAGGLLFERADVHEVDALFLPDLLRAHRLAPLPATIAQAAGALVPAAAAAATRDGALVAMPHWLCTDFLFARRDGGGLGILVDMAGPDALGELYLTGLLAERGSAAAAVADLGGPLDQPVVAALSASLAGEPAGQGRAAGRDQGFYARRFVHGAGAGYVGYSESLHEALDEASYRCRPAQHCLRVGDIVPRSWHLPGLPSRPVEWIDMFTIDARTDAQTRADAADFIIYAMREASYRALLVPPPGEAPRYLMPATEAAYRDPAILAAGPLYPALRKIIDTATVVQSPELAAALHAKALVIDRDFGAGARAAR